MQHNVSKEPFVRRHRTLFLSDFHLGAFGARADLLLRFLLSHEAESYFLVGDILETGESFLSRWTPNHQAVIDLLHARRDAGARLIYVRGNHDPNPDKTPAQRRLPVEAVPEAVHIAADGRRYLVVHGDAQDNRILRWHLLTRLGSQIDQLLRTADALIERYVYDGARDSRSVIEILRALANRGLYPGRPHEHRLVELARDGGFDGVICGHYHMAELRQLSGLSYANCGDWLDSFTGLGEDFTGRVHLLGGRATTNALPRTVFLPSKLLEWSQLSRHLDYRSNRSGASNAQ